MRPALRILAIVAALFIALSHAWAFDCFETPEGKRRCACIGADDCSEMRQSGSCKPVQLPCGYVSSRALLTEIPTTVSALKIARVRVE